MFPQTSYRAGFQNHKKPHYPAHQARLLAYYQWWLTLLFSMAFFATVGPFIYFYIQKKAEDRLFQEQKRYQATLRQASSGMGRIKDLNRLVNLIVHIVTRTVRLEHSSIFLLDSQSNKYFLRSTRSREVRFHTSDEINPESTLVQQL